MGDMRAELARRLEQERSEYDRLMKSIEQLYQQGALASNDGAQAVFVEGAANLVTHHGTEEDRAAPAGHAAHAGGKKKS
jgi:heat-inducible transcriptional repressor